MIEPVKSETEKDKAAPAAAAAAPPATSAAAPAPATPAANPAPPVNQTAKKREEEAAKAEEEAQKSGKGFNWTKLLGPLLAGVLSFFMGSLFGMNTILAGMLAAGAAFVVGPQLSKTIEGWFGSDDKSAQAGGNQRTTAITPRVVLQIDDRALAAAAAQSADQSRVSLTWVDGSLKLGGVQDAAGSKGIHTVKDLQAQIASCGAGGTLNILSSPNEALPPVCAIPPAPVAQRQSRPRG